MPNITEKETTEVELMARTAELRMTRGIKAQPKSTPTLGDALHGTGLLGSGSRTEMQTCDECGKEYLAVRLMGHLSPCPYCNPLPSQVQRAASPSQGAEEADRPKYKGNILDDLAAAGVNVHKYQDATLKAFDPSHDAHAVEAAMKWIEAWKATMGMRYPARDWMYFYGAGSERSGRDVRLGKVGNGKTMLQIAIARYLIENGLLNPARFRFVTAETIILEAEATFRSGSEDSEKNLLLRYERPDLLIIDEFGARDMSPHSIRLFDELTKRREAKGTLWNSNLSPKVLAGGPEYMKRIVDRIAGEVGDGACYAIEFGGPSRRNLRSRQVRIA